MLLWYYAEAVNMNDWGCMWRKGAEEITLVKFFLHVLINHFWMILRRVHVASCCFEWDCDLCGKGANVETVLNPLENIVTKVFIWVSRKEYAPCLDI